MKQINSIFGFTEIFSIKCKFLFFSALRRETSRFFFLKKKSKNKHDDDEEHWNMQVIELKDVIGFTRMQASSFDI